MDTYVKVSGTWKSVTPFVKVGGAWKTVNGIYTNVSGTWKKVYEPAVVITVTASPTSVGAFCYAGGPINSCSATSDPVSASPSGGTAPYTYSWQFVSGDSSIVANSPSSSTTTFSGSGMANTTASAYYRCQVTDSLSNIAYSNDVLVDMYYNE